jgi:hypothetical protein
LYWACGKLDLGALEYHRKAFFSLFKPYTIGLNNIGKEHGLALHSVLGEASIP